MKLNNNSNSKFDNDPVKYFLYQDKIVSCEAKKKVLEEQANTICMEMCPLCEKAYDLA